MPNPEGGITLYSFVLFGFGFCLVFSIQRNMLQVTELQTSTTEMKNAEERLSHAATKEQKCVG